MKTIALSLVLFFISFSAFAVTTQQSTPGLNCSISGDQLKNAVEVTNQMVAPRFASTLSLALGEDVDFGTYLTYVKLNLHYNPAQKQQLYIDAKAIHSEIEDFKLTSPLTADIQVKSRVNRQPMKVSVACKAYTYPYLLAPKYDDAQNPLEGFQNPALTLVKFLNDVEQGHYSFKEDEDTHSAFLAEQYCIEGSAQQFFNEISQVTRTSAKFWKSSALGDRILFPENLRLTSVGVQWEQPNEKATCIKSHEERRTDPEGDDTTVTICDQYRVDKLPSTALTIKICK